MNLLIIDDETMRNFIILDEEKRNRQNQPIEGNNGQGPRPPILGPHKIIASKEQKSMILVSDSPKSIPQKMKPQESQSPSPQQFNKYPNGSEKTATSINLEKKQLTQFNSPNNRPVREINESSGPISISMKNLVKIKLFKKSKKNHQISLFLEKTHQIRRLKYGEKL